MDILKTTMDKLTPITAVRDGMGLEDRIRPNKLKDKELLPACAPHSGYGSDAEGMQLVILWV